MPESNGGPFRRRWFHQFFSWNISVEHVLLFSIVHVCSFGPTGNKFSLALVMSWYPFTAKPLADTMMTRFTEIYTSLAYYDLN